MPVQQKRWGTVRGKKITLYILTQNELEARIITYGGILAAVEMPDKNGKRENITLGYPELKGYLSDSAFIGAAVGRYANRIANGEFSLNGQKYALAKNNGPNHLHGGPGGFHTQVWDAEILKEKGADGVILHYKSADREEGYPGNLDVQVIYKLTPEGELRIDYEAKTDRPTPVNLTNHAYWNLAGRGTIYEHRLKLFASRYLPVDDTAIPLGNLASVLNSPMDFTVSKKVSLDIGHVEGGFDHCYVIDASADRLAPAASLEEPRTGRIMEVFTTMPGIQFYSGNFLSDPFVKHGALCLETQYFPDSPNRPAFPSCILNPGQTYRHTTVHRFSVI
jgi:aldose 1-epimerase